MSEKWETVGTGKSTSKKSTTGSKTANGIKPAKKEKMVYTMEDVLPASSVVNSFASAFDPVPTPKSPKKEAKYVWWSETVTDLIFDTLQRRCQSKQWKGKINC